MLDQLLASTLASLREEVRQLDVAGNAGGGSNGSKLHRVEAQGSSVTQSEALRFFPASVAFLGEMSDAQYSHMPCRVDRFVPHKQRWAVTVLVRPEASFGGKPEILVRGDKLSFDYWAAPASLAIPLPVHLRVASDCSTTGLGLFCTRSLVAGEVVLREHPLMEVRNEGGDPLKSQWMLFFMHMQVDCEPDGALTLPWPEAAPERPGPNPDPNPEPSPNSDPEPDPDPPPGARTGAPHDAILPRALRRRRSAHRAASSAACLRSDARRGCAEPRPGGSGVGAAYALHRARRGGGGGGGQDRGGACSLADQRLLLHT